MPESELLAVKMYSAAFFSCFPWFQLFIFRQVCTQQINACSTIHITG